jgi:translation initiation factor 3 subunit F
MLALHLRANKRETIVGWYATALPPDNDASADDKYKFIADTSSLIHEFYASECEDDPIHLVVDTSLISDAMELRAYKSSSVTVKNDVLANIFNEVRLSVRSSESERICMDRMISSKDAPTAQDETKSLRLSMEKLLEMLETASTYVDSVLSSAAEPDETIGRDILDSLNSIPRIRPEVFDKMFNDSLQDLLMVTYLSNITKTQLSIAEKLNATLGK